MAKTEFCLWLTDPGTRPNTFATNVVGRRGCFSTRGKANTAAIALRKKTSYAVNVVETFKKRRRK